ncbi:hypothetical protein TNCV_1841561 [Trichonephila clavipes]|nr:hypothetical protein TNCV_1841561 [Trichonephila clavipes]
MISLWNLPEVTEIDTSGNFRQAVQRPVKFRSQAVQRADKVQESGCTKAGKVQESVCSDQSSVLTAIRKIVCDAPLGGGIISSSTRP